MVVVLPLLPVMATMVLWVYWLANSISEIIGMCFSRAFLMMSALSGIPGLFIMQSAASMRASS